MNQIVASTPEAYQLLMQGAQALTDVEANGMRIDVDYLDRVIKQAGQKIRRMEVELKDDEIWALWRKTFPGRAELGSKEQLGKILFGVMEIPSTRTTDTGRAAADIEALEEIDLPFVKKFLSLEKLKKARGTYLQGIRRETVDGFLHPNFDLCFARTFRSSSSTPNFQNMPIRDPRQAKLIRRAFIPRTPEHLLVEIDYSALEFRGAACQWNDPSMVAYASDPSLDIHRDMTAECYSISADQVTKAARGMGKNKFVFPILYGSYWGSCAEALWAVIDRMDLKTVDGVGLHEHLSSVGINALGNKKHPEMDSFYRHVKKVEQRFGDRFPVWRDKKEVWWNEYLKRGWFKMMTGFVCKGVYTKNNIYNYPIQGPSFHLLLWSLIQVNEWLKQNKMRSKVIGQIHDSMVLDVHQDEFDDVIYEVNQVMTQKVRQHWDWIVVPLEIEAEASPTNWFEKKAVDVTQVV